jgi:single-strand DNA-binding protein
MNVIILSGNLGNDPDSKYSQEGMHIVTFPMAFSAGKKKTGWIRVTCFETVADIAVKYLHKGARVAVTGVIDQDKWVTDSNETRTAIKIIAKGIDFIKTDGRGFEDKNGGTDNHVAPPDDDIPPF